MTRFIETKDQSGKAVLVNLDRVDTVTFDEGQGTATVLMPEGEKTFRMSVKEFKSGTEDNVLERISGNLFHIWEILRARLH